MSRWLLRGMVAAVALLCLPYAITLLVRWPQLIFPATALGVASRYNRRRARAARVITKGDVPTKRRPDPAWRQAWAAKEVERWGYVIPWASHPAPQFLPAYVGITSERTWQRDDGTWWSDRWDRPDHLLKRERYALDYSRAFVKPLGVLSETAAEQTWELPTIAQLCGQGHQLLNIIGNPRPWR